MAERRPMFRYAVMDGEPVSVGGVRVTPQARVLEIHWPGGGLVWNRPVAVTVERGGGTMRMPIVDATRVAQIALGAFAAVYALVTAAQTTRSMRRRHE
jgi:hypothetical protein